VSRQIKFRAWHIKSGQMATWEDIMTIDTEGLYHLVDMLNGDLYTVMQYTGLCDKNGKEICEGDIVNHSLEGEWLFEVRWDDIVAGFYMQDPSPNAEEDDHLRLVEEVEVIGNIYETPELLKKED
jgi:uncharacterized phage protein (TIGR01671 family)